jgi:protein-tyrosine sulfotransferase
VREADLQPIFILGVSSRSGTNYLWDLMLCHEDVAAMREPVKEDFLLHHCGFLLQYTSAVRGWWDPMWGEFTPELMRSFHSHLGEGLISFLKGDAFPAGKYLLAKSPSVKNIQHFFTFFPEAYLVILVRDGRSVVQSCIDTFEWDFDTACRRWAEGVNRIRDFRERTPNHAYLLVAYERLVDEPTDAMSSLLTALGLDLGRYDFEAASVLPVRGSSSFFGPGRDSVHWDPVEKDETFAPKERFAGWPREQQERFQWLAGEQLAYLGYGRAAPTNNSKLGILKQRARDLRWLSAQAARESMFRGRVRVGTATRPLRRRMGLLRDRA